MNHGSRSGIPQIALRETCRVVGGAVPLWDLHRARLAMGGCGEELLSLAESRTRNAAAAWEDLSTHRARLTVVVDEKGSVETLVDRGYASIDIPRGPIVARIDVGRPPALPPGPAKPADRSEYDDAHRRARALGAHQGVLVDPDGEVIDGSTATVWIVECGELVTPPSPPAIPGVARAFILGSAERAGFGARVEPVSWERFEAADEAFLTNAFGGAVPVRSRGGPVTDRVASLFGLVWRY